MAPLTSLSTRLIPGCALLWWAAAAATQPRPHALEMLRQERQRLKTGEVEFFWRDERDLYAAVFYTGRFAGQDNILITHAAEDGAGPGPEGSGQPRPYGPHCQLQVGHESWVYEGDGLSAHLWQAAPGVPHVWKMRALGTQLRVPYKELPEVVWSDQWGSTCEFAETHSAGLHVVTADCRQHGTYTWYIDAARGWSPVRITHTRGNKIMEEARCTPAKFDGVWFPQVIDFFRFDYQDGQEPVESLYVYAAAFNRPDQPTRFTPADVGVEAGMLVDVETPGDQHETRVWDGQKLIPPQEAAERQRAGQLKPGLTVLRTRAGLPVPRWHTYQSQWEGYVREFIARHRLDRAQTQRALAVLADCRQQAGSYLQSHKEKFEQAEAKLVAGATSQPAGSADSAAATACERLMAPIDDIFRKQLVPRLDGLLTPVPRAGAAPRTQGN